MTKKGKEKESKLPYVKKNYLLTKAEKDFFRILEQVIENKYYVFPQIHLSQLLLVKTERQERLKYRNKITQKSVDFVIVEKNYLNPLLAIELDDSSHNRKDRIKRDNFIEKALKDAGLPLLRIKRKQSYNVHEISSLIYNILDNKEKSKSEN